MGIQTVKDFDTHYTVNDNTSVPKKEGNRDYKKVVAWLQENPLTAKYTLNELKVKRIGEIKTEANRKIIAAYPEWKQRNFMVAVVDIQNKELIALKANTTYTLSADELATVAAAQAAKTEIFNIRAKSDELEASLDSMTLEQLEAFDPTDNSNWI